MELLSDCQDRAVEAGAPFGDVMEANLYGSDMPQKSSGCGEACLRSGPFFVWCRTLASLTN